MDLSSGGASAVALVPPAAVTTGAGEDGPAAAPTAGVALCIVDDDGRTRRFSTPCRG